MGENTLQKTIEGYRVNIKYGDKLLLECMEIVIRRVLAQSVDPHKTSDETEKI